MNSSIILLLLCLLLAYTLFYTSTNDFGMFLFILLLMLTIYYLKELVEEKINAIVNKVDMVKDDLAEKINDIKTNVLGLLRNPSVFAPGQR